MRQIEHLASLAFLSRKENTVCLRASRIGKTHQPLPWAKSAGIKTRFTAAAGLILTVGAAQRQWCLSEGLRTPTAAGWAPSQTGEGAHV